MSEEKSVDFRDVQVFFEDIWRNKVVKGLVTIFGAGLLGVVLLTSYLYLSFLGVSLLCWLLGITLVTSGIKVFMSTLVFGVVAGVVGGIAAAVISDLY